MRSPVRSAAARVNILVARQGRAADDPRVLAARRAHVEASVAAAIRRLSAGVPRPTPDEAVALVLTAWDAQAET